MIKICGEGFEPLCTAMSVVTFCVMVRGVVTVSVNTDGIARLLNK